MAFGGRMKELMKKYGKVAIGVHLSVSAASIAGLYVAIRNNVDVDSLFRRFGLSRPDNSGPDSGEIAGVGDRSGEIGEGSGENREGKRNRTAEVAATSGGALALAVLCNKALFPIRVPVTIGLTPPIARFLARRKLLKTGL